jgi:hypothetical protein
VVSSANREEQLDRIALVKAVAAPIGVEIAPRFKRIELRVSDVNRPAMDAQLAPAAVALSASRTCERNQRC